MVRDLQACGFGQRVASRRSWEVRFLRYVPVRLASQPRARSAQRCHMANSSIAGADFRTSRVRECPTQPELPDGGRHRPAARVAVNADRFSGAVRTDMVGVGKNVGRGLAPGQRSDVGVEVYR